MVWNKLSVTIPILLIMFGAHAEDEFNCTENIIPKISEQYIFIGEDHGDYGAKVFLSTHLDKFRATGFKTIFVEFIESRDQPIIDRFNQNPQMYFQDIARTFAQSGDWGHDIDSYIELILNIGQQGIAMRGLDRRSDYELQFKNLEEKTAIRDQHMFEVVKNYISSHPKEKIIFFNGSDHAFKNSNLIAPSFYERFVDYFGSEKVINLKKEYHLGNTLVRRYLNKKYGHLNHNCSSGFLFYRYKGYKSEFDYYIIEDNKQLMPIDDRYSTQTI